MAWLDNILSRMAWLFNIFVWLYNRIVKWRNKWLEPSFRKCIEAEEAEESLELLLKLMSLRFRLDKDFRENNITGFKGRYQFRSVSNRVTMAAIFTGKGLKVEEKLIPDPDIEVIFKDGKSLMNYLLAENRDILRPVLNNEVVLKGNVNYILKFGYMANHLQLALTGRLP